ncbi:Response regulator receiver domain-containing protein [Cyclobacterium lianum]|uniref:Response regulator receiver domain-containing protein n=1 Tax=Cyclobacterium lianum TaxID=388280 RepID=A0A1M7Q8J8_9BACT|nr:response regulator [Cyclobacterium lianum]SHN26881.1 Response regulator receiver domain-containing protein [Cyclobacterium lianum]
MSMLRIFIIEDNEGDVLLISDALAELNIPLEVSYAKDGHEAVEVLEDCLCASPENIPDLILLDINLPKKNGQEVLQFIKTSNGLKQIPVIMLTTSSSERDILESYHNHANSYISKPMGPESYQDILQKIESFWFSLVKLPTQV